MQITPISASYADKAGSIVRLVDDVGNSLTVLVSDALAVDFISKGGVIEPYKELPSLPESWPKISDGGLARFSGVSPVLVLESVRTMGVTRISKGRYRVTHQASMPSDQYSASASLFDALPRVSRVTARTASFVEVRVTDLEGVAQDAAEITIKTERVMAP